MKRPSIAVMLIAVTALIGAGLVVAPTAAGWFSQAFYSQEIIALARSAKEIQPESRSIALEEAHLYNGSLIGSIEVAANSNLPQGTVDREELDYNKVLAADTEGLMARLKIPAINLDLPVYHGTSDKTLEMGVGHLQGSAIPVGGESTHSVLTAHRGLAKAELFTRLNEIKEGDKFTIEVFGEVLVYQVFETKVVDPSDTESLYPQLGRDLVTLITCTPLGINTHRILVTGERITPTPVEDLLAAGAAPEIPGFPWWALGLAAVVVLAGLYVWVNSREKVEIDEVQADETVLKL